MIGLVEDDEIVQTLERMREEAAEAAEMMKTYLGEDADGLDGLEFLVMAEAAEVGHAEVLRRLGAYSVGPKNRRVEESRPTNGIVTSFYSRHKAEVERMLDRPAGVDTGRAAGEPALVPGGALARCR